MDEALGRYQANVRTLCSIALTRLPGMIDPATGLVVFRAWGDRMIPSGTSLRYTAITAIGLGRAEAAGLSSAVDLEGLYEALEEGLSGCDNSGDVGLVLWAACHGSRSLAERALRMLLEFGDIARTRHGGRVHATELAWVTIGLAEALGAAIGNERDVRVRLDRAFQRLLAMRGASGLVGHAQPLSREGTRLPFQPQAELGFFDAQVYTLLAALKREAIIPDPVTREVARTLVRLLLGHQHPKGQWGWRYNVRTGALIDLYPVYSVHQDGMAPMALLLAEQILGMPTTLPVARGVDWLFGQNELGESMADEPRAIIWRSIRRKAPFRNIALPLKALSVLGVGSSWDLGACLASPKALEVDREMRPYHLGFCLYAFAELAAAEHGAMGTVFDSEPHPTLRTGEPSASTPGSRASQSA